MLGAALLSLILLATFVGFFFLWPLAIAWRLWSGKPTPLAPGEGEAWSAADVLREGWHRFWTGHFLPWTPRRHVPWIWFDMAVVGLPVAVLVVLPLLGSEPEAPKLELKPQQYQVAVFVDAALKIGYLLLATTYLVVRAGARLRDFGLLGRDLGKNVLVGIVAFPMIAIPVYALQAAIVWYGKWAYEHPLIEMLEKSPDFGLFLVLALSACVIAPLTEELFFRAMFQGWLERAFSWLGGEFHADPEATANPEVVLLRPAADAVLNPYAPPVDVQVVLPVTPSPPKEAREVPFPRSILVHWVPILCSSVLFGMAHFGHGPAPITLTVLALALGYIYQRTHSMVPVIVIHALFNSVSMLLFYVYMFEWHKPLP